MTHFFSLSRTQAGGGDSPVPGARRSRGSRDVTLHLDGRCYILHHGNSPYMFRGSDRSVKSPIKETLLERLNVERRLLIPRAQRGVLKPNGFNYQSRRRWIGGERKKNLCCGSRKAALFSEGMKTDAIFCLGEHLKTFALASESCVFLCLRSETWSSRARSSSRSKGFLPFICYRNKTTNSDF